MSGDKSGFSIFEALKIRFLKTRFHFFLLPLLFFACQNGKNHLSESNSPYLLQHAENPVHWFPWQEEAFEKAEAENKLIILSIGYAACHWCHVMEEECFEDEEVAEYMNQHFIAIKVDREERPDLDEIYQRASELTTGKGGWPLNVICLPDGKPFYSTTYSSKNDWLKLLKTIQKHYLEKPEELQKSAEKITQGVKESQYIFENERSSAFSREELDSIVLNWKQNWDLVHGGEQGAPKFPLPVNLNFILNYGCLKQDSSSINFVKESLVAMARGGLYDHLVGGFARYSTDEAWRIPHFEKMLYDNAQLISLYAKASKAFSDPYFLEVAKTTMAFAEKEWQGEDLAFSSSTDADTEGEEGTFYTWTLDELQAIISKEDWPLFEQFFCLKNKAKWEEGRYILQKEQLSNTAFIRAHNLDPKAFEAKQENWKAALISQRNLREKPSIDDKKLSSWNALMLCAYADLYRASSESDYLAKAEKLGQWFISQKPLLHAQRGGKESSTAFLQDYALASSAFIELFLLSGNPNYLQQAESWMKITLENFRAENSPLFHTRSTNAESLVANGIETADQVLPSANAVMAHNFLKLSILLENTDYWKQTWAMLRIMQERSSNYPNLHAHWLSLAIKESYPFYEVLITGPDAQELSWDLESKHLPQAMISWATKSDLGIFENRFQPGENWIYVCEFGRCKQPVQESEAALAQIWEF